MPKANEKPLNDSANTDTGTAQSAPSGDSIVEQALKNHPGLTREKAEAMLEAFGG